MISMEEKIRTRAYELWEQAGRTGAPEDHWLQAERELTDDSRSAATVEDAPPLGAVEAASGAPATDNGGKSKGKKPQTTRAS